MRLYDKMMMNLLQMRTQYIDLQQKAFAHNDKRMYRYCELKLEKIDELMKEVRSNFNNWYK